VEMEKLLTNPFDRNGVFACFFFVFGFLYSVTYRGGTNISNLIDLRLV